MTGYTKLFSSIITSTIWREPNEVRLLWITMLALSNKHGEVEASIPGLADMARISISETEVALETLSSPDKYSRSADHEGRRIEKVEGGWVILNYVKYRALLSADERREYFRVKKAEERKRKKDLDSPKMSLTVLDNPHCQHIAEAEAKVQKQKVPVSIGKVVGKPSLPKDRHPTSEPAKRIAGLFRRRLTTAWAYKEIKAFKDIGEINIDDLEMIESYYERERAKGINGIHRRDLYTFLNNFPGELDRARGATRRRKQDTTEEEMGVWTELGMTQAEWREKHGAEWRAKHEHQERTGT